MCDLSPQLISSRDSGLKPSASKPLIKALSEGLCKVMDRLTASQVSGLGRGSSSRNKGIMYSGTYFVSRTPTLPLPLPPT